ncbi:hypothetical protein ACF09J_26035 [Streptomyces sp. NPDC014889]
MQYADYTLWQRDTLGDDRDPYSTMARQIAFWRRGYQQIVKEIDRAS